MIKLLILLAQLSITLQWCLKQTYYELAGSPINEIDWSPDNNFIVVGSDSKRVTVISFITSNVVWFQSFSNIVTTCKFGNTGKYLAVGFSGDDTVRIYNVPSFTPLSNWRAQHGNT
jgi:WD40 repeat protein